MYNLGSKKVLISRKRKETMRIRKKDTVCGSIRPVFKWLTIIGCFPAIDTGEDGFQTCFGNTSYKFQQVAILVYTLCILVSSISIFLVNLEVRKKTHDESISSQYEFLQERAIDVIICINAIGLPLSHWCCSKKLCRYFQVWNELEHCYYQVTKTKLVFCRRWKILVSILVIVAVSGVTLLLNDKNENSLLRILLCYCFCLYLSNTMLWILLCRALASTSLQIIDNFTKGVQGYRGLVVNPERYIHMWNILQSLTYDTGKILSLPYILHFIMSFVTVTANLYFLLFPSVHRFSTSLIGRSIWLIIAIYLILKELQSAHSAGEQMTRNAIEKLQILHCKSLVFSDQSNAVLTPENRNFGPSSIREDKFPPVPNTNQSTIEISSWIQRIAMDRPEICLAGFITVNKQLALKMLSSLVIYLAILLQFRVLIEGESITILSE